MCVCVYVTCVCILHIAKCRGRPVATITSYSAVAWFCRLSAETASCYDKSQPLLFVIYSQPIIIIIIISSSSSSSSSSSGSSGSGCSSGGGGCSSGGGGSSSSSGGVVVIVVVVVKRKAIGSIMDPNDT